MKTSFIYLFASIILLNAAFSQSLPPNTTDFRGLWVTNFQTDVLGDTVAENKLLAYAVANDLNYLICTNMFLILTDNCIPFTSEMEDLKLFIQKAHQVYNIEYISGNVGSDATAMKIQDYNNCSGVAVAQRFDMITYECEFYNPATNASCPSYTSFFTQLQNIKTICTTTISSDTSKHLICEVYVGGSGSTGLVLTNSTELEMKNIAKVADHILITYYRSDPSSSGGNFFNWTITRLQWLSGPAGNPNKIVLLFKSRNTDTNNMYNYLVTYPGTHFEGLRAPYYSWVDGMAFDSSLTKGYVESFADSTYPWLNGIQVTGFTWFEHEANLEISDSLAVGLGDILEKEPIRLFPNPARDRVTVEGIEVGQMELLDMAGRIVRNSNGNSIRLNGCPNGIYLVRVKIKDGFQFGKVVVGD
jgi:hypothetical protein